MAAKNRAHDIRDKSENQFEGFIVSLEWEHHKPNHDYGLDYWIEVFSQGDPTGDNFYVQLKGTDRPQRYYLEEERVYFYSIPVKKLKTWYRNILPVYLVLWDIQTRQGYWVYVQEVIESHLKADPNWLDTTTKDAKKSIHIPPGNIIREGFSAEFESDLAERLLELRNRKETLRLMESYRGVSGTETLAQLLQLNTVEEVEGTQRSERMAAVELSLRTNLSNDELWLEKARLHYEQLQFEEALRAIAKARELNKSSLNVAYTRACILCEQANANGKQPKRSYLEAIALFEECRSISSPAIYHYNLGNCYSSLEQYPTAINHYDLALAEKLSPDLAAQIWKNRGTCFFHQGDYIEEKRSYEMALELNPNLWQAIYSLAVTLNHLKRFEEAEEIIVKNINLVPDLVSIQAETQYLLAYVKWHLSKAEEALEAVDKALELKPEYESAYWLKVEILIILWTPHNKYIETAKRFFEIMMLEHPTNPLPRNELHHILKAQGKHEAAKKILKEALDNLENNLPVMFYDYGMLLKEEGDVDEAIKYLKKGVNTDVYHPIEHELGHLYFAKEDYASALHWYKAALASSGRAEISSMGSIAHCSFLVGDYQASAIMLMELILFDPALCPEHWDNLNSSLTLAGVNGTKIKSQIASAKKAAKLEDIAAIFDQVVEELSPGEKRSWLALQKGIEPFEH